MCQAGQAVRAPVEFPYRGRGACGEGEPSQEGAPGVEQGARQAGAMLGPALRPCPPGASGAKTVVTPQPTDGKLRLCPSLHAWEAECGLDSVIVAPRALCG